MRKLVARFGLWLAASGAALLRRVDTQQDRDRFLHEARHYVPYIAGATRVGPLLVDTRNHSKKARLLVRDGRLDTSALSLAMQGLRACGVDPTHKGKVFIDVGAYIGTTAIPAVTDFGFERCVAVEPEPGNYNLLNANIGLNALESVQTARLALSGEEGVASLRRQQGFHGGHRIVTSREASDAKDVIQVDTTTLDRLLERLGVAPGEVGFVKLDTEGHEANVLEGSSDLLTYSVPFMIEYCPHALARQDALSMLERIAMDCFGRFLDLRKENKVLKVSGSPSMDFRPVEEIRSLRSEYSGRVTDLLLVPERVA